MADEKKKINYRFISEQLENLGWVLLSGSGDRQDSFWEHKLVKRRFSIYEAALCHNLLVNINGMHEDGMHEDHILHGLYNIYLYTLRLLADGWSIDTSELYLNDDVYISIHDRRFWWRQISSGGKRYDFDEASSFVESNKELDCFFLEYLGHIRLGGGRVYVFPNEIVKSDFVDANNTCFTEESIKKALLLEEKRVVDEAKKEALSSVTAIDDLNKYVSIEITDEALKIVLDKKLLVFIGNDIRENLMRLQKNSQALVDDLEQIMKRLVALNEKIG